MNTLDTVNSAIEEHADTAVFGKVLEMAKTRLDGERLGVAVYEEDPDAPFDYYTVQFNKGRLELKARGKASPTVDWKVSQEYLSAISENPDAYIANPAKLDIDWLKARVGMDIH
ncbi:hypothetical protein NOR51B_630 [Luminiphilus syltensis NOR5-1B]|uniref:Uncharacterized protein n=2 Tax=Luminiphilus TaxID=1341118 RepID=B8KTW2_9GAMM|nr:hypothetical protein NOR51B_630 [Luminiphilus syltensis NOR5-1B]